MAICWQRLPDHGDSLEALVNEVVWKALQNEPKFKGRARFSTWFYRIVSNACNRYLRSFKRKCVVPLENEGNQVLSGLPARVAVIEILDGLNEDEAKLCQLVAEGYTWAEIGEILGMTRQGAQMKWRRLKEALRDA